MGQRKARLAHQRKHGGEVPPPINGEMTVIETVVIFKRVSKRIDEEYAASPYHDKLTRAQYMALLLEAACGHEEKLREQASQQGSLVKLATHIPAGMADAAARLRALKETQQ